MKNVKLKSLGVNSRRIIMCFFLSFLTAFFESFGTAMFLPVLQFVESGQDVVFLQEKSKIWIWLIEGFDFLGVKISLLSLLVAVVLIIILRIIITYVRQIFFRWVSQDVLHKTRINIFGAYLRAKYEIFDNISSGKIVNVVTTETQRISGYLTSLFELIANGIILAGYLIVMIWISISMTVFVAVILIAGGLLVSYFVRRTKKVSYRITDANKELSSMFIERLSAIRLLKLGAAAEREINKMDDSSRDVRDNIYTTKSLHARVDLILEPFIVVATGAILYGSISYFNMSLAQLGVFMLIIMRLLPVTKLMLSARQTVMANSGSMKAVSESIKEAEKYREVPTSEKGLTFTGVEDGIRLEDVSFYYPGSEEPALKNVNLYFPAKKTTAIVGPSGSGKSTLVDLLPLLRVPQKGQITFDGIPAQDFEISSLRIGMSFVSQDVTILNDTVLNNITFLKPGANDREVWEALEWARAEEFVKKLPKRLNTILGERGVKLSGGQRQRLSLARALLQEAPILILDEPTSSLDSKVEKEIQETIDSGLREKEMTVIYITHRLSTIRDADKVVVLEDGRVVDEGTHEDLMKNAEWYKKISKLQMLK